VGPAVTGEQAGALADVRARPFQLAATLAGPLTGPAAVDMPPVPMPLESGLGKIGHDVVLELACGFEVAGAAMGALPGTDVVFDEDGAGRRPGPKGSGCRRCSWRRRSVRGPWGSSQRWDVRRPRRQMFWSWCSTWPVGGAGPRSPSPGQ
jgi:hypothetical protein